MVCRTYTFMQSIVARKNFILLTKRANKFLREFFDKKKVIFGRFVTKNVLVPLPPTFAYFETNPICRSQ